ncbi:GntR family transcriptional regulator [Glutamicibacter uratoxydans]|uniref:GntR family transcriptional regulator n=1 Tax=Glutamicibacter uratoxydans TaxID=43667 RepID=UPI001FE470DA|nr:GntR family transcriptional regulator [Glutamicibacter uratoxydans]
MADSEFKPESLRVTERIRDEIIDGVRAPGSRLVERELAEELGVSRLPIRDALHILANEGLITPRPRTWAVVREFSASDIADLQEVREAMEVMTFKLAAQRHTRNGLDELRAVLETEIEASKKQDYVTARRAGAKFHELVVGLAGNELLIELQAGLSSRMRWLLSQHDDLEIMAEEHAQILEAMASRNLELVERLVLQHIATSKGSVDEKRASMQ